MNLSIDMLKTYPNKKIKVQFFLYSNLINPSSLLWSSFMVDPLTPKSDSHLISPGSVSSEININVKRIKEMIAN